MGVPQLSFTVMVKLTFVTFPSKSGPRQVVMQFLRMGMLSITVDVSRSLP
jgi:hypothetical protein